MYTNEYVCVCVCVCVSAWIPTEICVLICMSIQHAYLFACVDTGISINIWVPTYKYICLYPYKHKCMNMSLRLQVALSQLQSTPNRNVPFRFCERVCVCVHICTMFFVLTIFLIILIEMRVCIHMYMQIYMYIIVYRYMKDKWINIVRIKCSKIWTCYASLPC